MTEVRDTKKGRKMRPYISFGGGEGICSACPTAVLPRTTTPWDPRPVPLFVGFAITPGSANSILCCLLFDPFKSPAIVPNEGEGCRLCSFECEDEGVY